MIVCPEKNVWKEELSRILAECESDPTTAEYLRPALLRLYLALIAAQ